MQWNETILIIEALEEQYPEIEIEDLTLNDLYDLILDLSDFSDDPANANDGILKKILEQWYEHRAESE